MIHLSKPYGKYRFAAEQLKGAAYLLWWLIPIDNVDAMAQLINTTETYTCSRNLFPFVNRSLNAMGLQARITDSRIFMNLPSDKILDDFPVRFTVGSNA
jgi:hypothetical protein